MRFLYIICAIFFTWQLHAQPKYYKAETHCHSINSFDGFIQPQQLLQDYKSRGYKIVFISDHDTLTDVESMHFPGIFSINSEELSCGSHFNGFNMKQTVPACGMSNQDKVTAILAQDALVCVNHPVAPSWRITALQILALQGKISFVEIYNPTDIYQAHDDQSLWDSLLTQGWHIWGIASGDVHQWYPLEDVWIGYTMIKTDTLTKDAVLDAMQRGDFYASTGVSISNYKVSGDTTTIACSNCVRIIFWGENHTVLKNSNSSSAQYIRQPNDPYVRVELVFDNFNKAWTQPVFYNLMTAVKNNSNDISAAVYPNPASDHFTFYYSLQSQSDVIISLYDLQGRFIRSLFSGQQTTGRHEVNADISSLPQGTYILKMEGEENVVKMVSVVR